MQNRLFSFDANALVTVNQATLRQELAEIEHEILEVISGGIDGTCGNNTACGAEINTDCTVVNAVCAGNNFRCQNPSNNLGCPNVGCEGA